MRASAQLSKWEKDNSPRMVKGTKVVSKTSWKTCEELSATESRNRYPQSLGVIFQNMFTRTLISIIVIHVIL